MTRAHIIHVSDEARREHEKQSKPVKRKKDCPSCEIKTEVISVKTDDDIKANKEGDK